MHTTIRLSAFAFASAVALGTLVPSSASAKPWTPLTQANVDAKGFCPAFTASSPVAEYWEVEKCSVKPKESIGTNQIHCNPKGVFKTFLAKCEHPLACNVVPDAVEGKLGAEYQDLFEGLLLQHDRALVQKLVSGPKYNQYFAGSCLQEDKFPFYEAILGLGIAGKPEQVASLNTLVSEDWRVDLLGKDLRDNLARSYFWLGNKAGAPSVMKLMPLAHVTQFPGRQFRQTILLALGEWGVDDGVSVCGPNLRDIQDGGDLGACMTYLARRGKKEFASAMVRQAGRVGDPANHALGLLGGPEATKYLESLESKGDGPGYLDRDIALANVGKANAWAKIEKSLKITPCPGQREMGALGWFSTNAALKKKAIALLTDRGNQCKKEKQPARQAYALAIRGQLGDTTVVKELAAFLDSPDREVRESAVRGIGSDWGSYGNGAPFAVVANPAILPALAKAHRDESEESLREEMARAMLNVRAVIRAHAGEAPAKK
ncbi:MAG: HEAT repeat domain-containing protein [Polyangiaceae bacterium]